MVRTRGNLDSAETNEAAWVATRGAVTGAARWGVYSAILGGLAYAASPVYRGLTIQFKVFIQMSGMTIGSMIEADNRLREHEWRVRQNRKMQRDAEVWKRYEDEFGPDPRRGLASSTSGPSAAAAAATTAAVSTTIENKD